MFSVCPPYDLLLPQKSKSWEFPFGYNAVGEIEQIPYLLFFPYALIKHSYAISGETTGLVVFPVQLSAPPVVITAHFR
ncbi:MAG: hypothetical protein R2771_14925 [Saprospiraceae bacterium]